MRESVARFALAALVGLPVGEWGAPRGRPPADRCPAGDALVLVERANEYRRARGLAPLVPDARLFEAADRIAFDLAARGVLDHTGSDGSTGGIRVQAAGYARTMSAENLAAGQTGAEGVVEAWAGSPGHRANLLSGRLRHAGAAHVVGKPACRGCGPDYWVLVLGDSRGPARPLPPTCSTPLASR